VGPAARRIASREVSAVVADGPTFIYGRIRDSNGIIHIVADPAGFWDNFR
jgi:hypothetical protein